MLRDELSYVEAYLALEKARLDDRLKVEWAVPTFDPLTVSGATLRTDSAQGKAEAWLDHPVPTLILQPVVENAVIHGIEETPGGGHISVTARLENDSMFVSVEDDGPGFSSEKLGGLLKKSRVGESSHIGISNVHERLTLTYGAHAGLHLGKSSSGGAAVSFRIPFKENYV